MENTPAAMITAKASETIARRAFCFFIEPFLSLSMQALQGPSPVYHTISAARCKQEKFLGPRAAHKKRSVRIGLCEAEGGAAQADAGGTRPESRRP